jgi:hypothetical protein
MNMEIKRISAKMVERDFMNPHRAKRMCSEGMSMENLRSNGLAFTICCAKSTRNGGLQALFTFPFTPHQSMP